MLTLEGNKKHIYNVEWYILNLYGGKELRFSFEKILKSFYSYGILLNGQSWQYIFFLIFIFFKKEWSQPSDRYEAYIGKKKNFSKNLLCVKHHVTYCYVTHCYALYEDLFNPPNNPYG